MKNTILISVFFSFFCYAIATAQSENKEIILGCWEVKQVIFTEEIENSDEISMDAIGTIICFGNDGKFTNNKGGDIVKGNYSLSENGRTLYQSPESEAAIATNQNVKNIPGQIVMLSATELQIQAEEMILYFRREN